MKNHIIFLSIFLILFGLAFTVDNIDKTLSGIIESQRITAYQGTAEIDSAKVDLARMLFFDKLLSGNRDVSCATCHHPGLRSGDNLSLAIGVGGMGLGASRIMGKGRDRIPRNSPEIFNRGAEEWHTMFWDGRVSGKPDSGFVSPADDKLPAGLENVLAAQAMFPVTSRGEMRGDIGDLDILGNENELALISDAAPQSIWRSLMKRILSYPKYRELFQRAYPEFALESLGFQHAANAIAAFEIEAFTFIESPWDRYLKGEVEAMSERAKRGAVLFYGKANCAGCHAGNLLTDQEFHNIAVPQFGPGKDNAAPLDVGRFAETGNPEDRFAFRTPPLRNVAITGPWMHNGAYLNLEDAIRHHLDPAYALRNYNLNQLAPELRESYKGTGEVFQKVLKNLDPLVSTPVNLTEIDLDDMLAFMEALTDSSALNLGKWIPELLPSGLSVEEIGDQGAHRHE